MAGPETADGRPWDAGRRGRADALRSGMTLGLTQAEQRRRIAPILREDLQERRAGAKFHRNRVQGQVTPASGFVRNFFDIGTEDR